MLSATDIANRLPRRSTPPRTWLPPGPIGIPVRASRENVKMQTTPWTPDRRYGLARQRATGVPDWLPGVLLPWNRVPDRVGVPVRAGREDIQTRGILRAPNGRYRLAYGRSANIADCWPTTGGCTPTRTWIPPSRISIPVHAGCKHIEMQTTPWTPDRRYWLPGQRPTGAPDRLPGVLWFGNGVPDRVGVPV